jgi:hypothetical protein
VAEDAVQRVASAFADIARRYIARIDGREGQSAEDFLLALHPLLCELIYRAAVLPDIEADGDLPRDHMTQPRWNRLHESLKALLGDYNLYWQVFDPVALDEDDPIRGTLADDLADIYRDVGKGLETAFDPAAPIPTMVVWSWRFNFFFHWGHHALEATRAIHAHIGYHDLDDPELRGENDADDEGEGA